MVKFRAHLNSIEPGRQFTLKREKDDTYPFLDVLVKRREEELTFLYTKDLRKLNATFSSTKIIQLAGGQDSFVQSEDYILIIGRQKTTEAKRLC